MNLQTLIHKNTWNDINGYLSICKPPSLILSGINGLGKFELGKYVASQLLACKISDLHNNPDFYVIGNNGSISVDDINSVIDFTNRSSVNDRKVILINQANTITVSSQNKLLKILEDRVGNILIFITNSVALIETVTSRCCCIQVQPLSEESMRFFLLRQGITESRAFFFSYMLENAPFLFLREKETLEEYFNQYERIKRITERSELLEVMHMKKEKDKKNFYELNGSHISWNIKLILYPFYECYYCHLNGISANNVTYPANLYSHEESFKILLHGQAHIRKKNYTKNDYFNLLRYIIEPEK